MSGGDKRDGRCAYVFPPESIRCVRSAVPGSNACEDHRPEASAALDAADDQEQRENDLRDRIALLEQRNGQLDADLHGLRRRLELEVRASRDYASAAASITVRAERAEQRVDDLVRKVERLANEKVALEERAHRLHLQRDLLEEQLHDFRREATTAQRQVDTAAEANGAWSEVHSTLESTELLEAQGGVFVPIPAGHMLSVTVTPYSEPPD